MALGTAAALAGCGPAGEGDPSEELGPEFGDSAEALTGALPVVTITFPTAGGTVGVQPTYRWNAIVNADSYRVWVNDRLSNPRVDIVVTAAQAGCAAGTGVCSTQPATLLRSGAGRMWVRAQNESGFGSWGQPLNFTIVALPQPINPTGLFVGTTPTYTWSPVAGAVGYQLWVNDSVGTAVNTTLTPAAANCNATLCSYTPNVPLANGNAKFWVRLTGGAWSAAHAFTVADVAAPPAIPTTVDPIGTGGLMPTFRWNSSATATSYTLWVNDSAGTAVNTPVTAVAAGCDAGGECSFAPGVVLLPGTVRWWVRARNSAGFSSWSPAAVFTAQ